jgi:hypothetical protein
LVWGLIMLGLFIIQIIANLRSHPKMSECSITFSIIFWGNNT